jgi:hypothetical protein
MQLLPQFDRGVLPILSSVLLYSQNVLSTILQQKNTRYCVWAGQNAECITA